MKRQKRLILLLGVLAVCMGGAVVLSGIDFDEKMTDTQTDIVNVDSSAITGLSWKYEEELSFTCADDTWTYDGDGEMPVDQELLGEIAENLSGITSDKKVEEVQSLGVYGLDSPAYSITVETEDETYEISIGDESFTDGEVYISIGDDYVYLTDAGLIDEISYGLLDCVEKEEIPEMETVTALSVDKEEAVDMVYKEEAGYCYSDAYTYYLKDGDTYRNLDNDLAGDTFDTLTGLEWTGCVDYHAEEGELSAYGLDEPDAAVSVSYETEDGEEKGFAYEVGTADDQYYAKLKDSDIVYSISSDVYDAAAGASYEELKPDEVVLLDWGTVESLDMELDGALYTVAIEESGDDGYTYTFDGEEVEFGDVVDSLEGIALDSEEEAEPGDNKEELTFTFHRSVEAYDTVELTFYQYNGSWCIAVLDGETLGCVSRQDVVDLKEAVNAIILDQG